MYSGPRPSGTDAAGKVTAAFYCLPTHSGEAIALAGSTAVWPSAASPALRLVCFLLCSCLDVVCTPRKLVAAVLLYWRVPASPASCPAPLSTNVPPMAGLSGHSARVAVTMLLVKKPWNCILQVIRCVSCSLTQPGLVPHLVCQHGLVWLQGQSNGEDSFYVLVLYVSLAWHRE